MLDVHFSPVRLASAYQSSIQTSYFAHQIQTDRWGCGGHNTFNCGSLDQIHPTCYSHVESPLISLHVHVVHGYSSDGSWI